MTSTPATSTRSDASIASRSASLASVSGSALSTSAASFAEVSLDAMPAPIAGAAVAPVQAYCSGATIDHVRAPTCFGCHRFNSVPGRRVPMREVIPQIIDGRVWCSQRVPLEA